MKKNLKFELEDFGLSTLPLDEQLSIEGGNWINDLGEWCGQKVGAACKVLASLDWTGSAAGD